MAKIESLEVIDKALPVVAQIIPVPAQAERFIKVARLAVASQPQLAEAEKGSLVRAILHLARMGLEPGVGYGAQAYLVPFWDSRNRRFNVVPIVSAQGLVTVLTRSGVVSKIESQVVYAGDSFDIVFGTESRLYHKPKLDGDRGVPIGVWAMAVLKDGGYMFEYMTFAEVERIRARSQSEKRQDGKPAGPWTTDWEEMAKKTVIKRLCKRLPIQPALSQDIQTEGLDDETLTIIEEAAPQPAEAPQEKAKLIAQRIKASAASDNPPGEETVNGGADPANAASPEGLFEKG